LRQLRRLVKLLVASDLPFALDPGQRLLLRTIVHQQVDPPALLVGSARERARHLLALEGEAPTLEQGDQPRVFKTLLNRTSANIARHRAAHDLVGE